MTDDRPHQAQDHERHWPTAHRVRQRWPGLVWAVQPALNTASRFWLIGEQPSITDLQSVRAAIAGLIVGLAPGTGGTPTHHFAGLDRAPPVMPGVKGRYFYLDTNMLGGVQQGASVLYEGQNIGTVTNTGFAGLDHFRIELFINGPFQNLVRPGALFWRGPPAPPPPLRGPGSHPSPRPAPPPRRRARDGGDIIPALRRRRGCPQRADGARATL